MALKTLTKTRPRFSPGASVNMGSVSLPLGSARSAPVERRLKGAFHVPGFEPAFKPIGERLSAIHPSSGETAGGVSTLIEAAASDAGDIAQNSLQSPSKVSAAGNSAVETVISEAENLDGKLGRLIWLDMGSNFLVGGGAAALGIAGKGAKAVGFEKTAEKADKAATLIQKPLKYLEHNTIGAKAPWLVEMLHTAAAGPVWLAKKINDTTGLLTRRADALRHKAEHVHGAKMMEHLEAIKTHTSSQELIGTLEELGRTSAHHQPQVFEQLMQKSHELAQPEMAGKEFRKTFGKFSKSLMKKAEALGKAEDWGHLAQGVNTTRQQVAGASLRSTALNGIFGFGAGVSMLSTGRRIYSDQDACSEIIAISTHQRREDVSSVGSLLSDLPYVASAARNALAKTAGPMAVLEAANAVLNYKLIRGSHLSRGGMLGNLGEMVWLMIPQLGKGLVDMVAGNNVLDAYKAARSAELHGQAMSTEQYAALIGRGEEQLQARGAENSEFAKALAQKYQTMGYSAKRVVEALASGEAAKDVHALIQQNTSEELPGVDRNEAAAGALEEKPSTSHVAALKREPSQRLRPERAAENFAGRLGAEISSPSLGA